MNNNTNFMYIVRQDSLGKENFSKNEVQKEVHVVSKNLPFLIELGTTAVNFQKARISAKLHYDQVGIDQPFKQVDYVKQEPMTYKTFVNEAGNRATVEIRILVLSSQHEDSNFCVKISVVDGNTNLCCEVFSEAMRVVSKPSLVNKKKNETKRKFESAGAPSASTIQNMGPLSPFPTSQPSESSTTSYNNTNNTNHNNNNNSRQSKSDAVLSILTRMERQQQAMMERLQMKTATSNIPDPDEDDFGLAFQKFLASYQRIPMQDRPTKMRKAVMDNLCQAPADLVELVSSAASTIAETASHFPENITNTITNSNNNHQSSNNTPPSTNNNSNNNNINELVAQLNSSSASSSSSCGLIGDLLGVDIASCPSDLQDSNWDISLYSELMTPGSSYSDLSSES